jgi:signal transduction histidine kinase
LLAGFLLADYFFIPPLYSIGKYGQIEWALLIGNAIPAIIGILLFESLRRIRVRLAAKTARLEQEVTLRKEAEKQLRAAQEQLREYALNPEKAVRERTSELNEAVGFLEKFCYTIAHDLRAPVRAITGFVNILNDELPQQLSGDAQMSAARLIAATRRMDKLIMDLLEYGHLSHVPQKSVTLSLDRVVGQTLSELGHAIDISKAAVEITAPLGGAWADAHLLQQAVLQLIQNALQFTKPNEPPRIRVWTEQRHSMVRLWIADQGIGIPREYQENIFGPFQTLSAPQVDRTGIGLAIVSKAAERMHAFVGVDSEPGRGSSFWLDLPRQSSEAQVHSRPPELLEASGTTPR